MNLIIDQVPVDLIEQGDVWLVEHRQIVVYSPMLIIGEMFIGSGGSVIVLG